MTQDIAYRVQPRQNIQLTLDVQPDMKLEAQIAEVSKGTTQNNLSYLVTALLPNKEARLLACLLYTSARSKAAGIRTRCFYFPGKSN